MKKLIPIFTFISLILPPGEVFAKGWISIGLPSIYQFSNSDNSTYLTGSELRGTPSGFMIHGSIYERPFIGYESYQISLDADNSDEVAAIIDIVFYDIGVRFKQRYTHIAIGYGYGSMKTECKVPYCSSFNYDEGIARQVFGQFGVVIWEKLSLHLSMHRVTGQNDVKSALVTEHIVLDGTLYSFGLKLEW